MKELPNVGLMRIVDAESGREMYIDTSSKRIRRMHHDSFMQHRAQLDDIFTKSNVDSISIATNEDYVKAMLMLFAKRA